MLETEVVEKTEDTFYGQYTSVIGLAAFKTKKRKQMCQIVILCIHLNFFYVYQIGKGKYLKCTLYISVHVKLYTLN